MPNHPDPTPSSASIKRHCGSSGIFAFVFVTALLRTFLIGQALDVNDINSQKYYGQINAFTDMA
jgi:hypothetical protein